MLQQTQVTTVWPYYERWMALFPSATHLAQAEQDQVLKLWEGLGYYSRARNLHKGAQYIVENHGGELPKSIKALEQVPGIGPYTAAAIASMAFEHVVPLIDGNVLRVMSRVWHIESDIAKTTTRKEITLRLDKVISTTEPGAFNQALMDLGRVICTPRNPQCPNCPLRDACQAYEIGDTEKLPVKARSKPIPHYDIVIGLIRKGEKVLIQKRPAKGLLGGLWEFPGGKIEGGETGEAALVREIQEETSLSVSVAEKIGSIDHAYTHFKITLTAWWCDWKKGRPQTFAATENKWIHMDEVPKYAFPKANLKVIELISKHFS